MKTLFASQASLDNRQSLALRSRPISNRNRSNCRQMKQRTTYQENMTAR